MMGLSTIGSISLGCALVAGKNRVPRPAAGKTALRTLIAISDRVLCALCAVFWLRRRDALNDWWWNRDGNRIIDEFAMLLGRRGELGHLDRLSRKLVHQ